MNGTLDRQGLNRTRFSGNLSCIKRWKKDYFLPCFQCWSRGLFRGRQLRRDRSLRPADLSGASVQSAMTYIRVVGIVDAVLARNSDLAVPANIPASQPLARTVKNATAGLEHLLYKGVKNSNRPNLTERTELPGGSPKDSNRRRFSGYHRSIIGGSPCLAISRTIHRGISPGR